MVCLVGKAKVFPVSAGLSSCPRARLLVAVMPQGPRDPRDPRDPRGWPGQPGVDGFFRFEKGWSWWSFWNSRDHHRQDDGR